jgi:effector-binding domain-containing protein
VSEEIEIVELRPQRVATIRRTVPRSGLGVFFGEVIPKIQAAIASQGGKPAGPPYGRYYNEDPAAFDTEAGIPFSGSVTSSGDVRIGELPGGPAAKTVHIGPYDTLPEEYPRIEAWLATKGKRAGRGPWEAYLDDMATTDKARLRTEVYWPIG